MIPHFDFSDKQYYLSLKLQIVDCQHSNYLQFFSTIPHMIINPLVLVYFHYSFLSEFTLDDKELEDTQLFGDFDTGKLYSHHP
jgi:hypothetical protein